MFIVDFLNAFIMRDLSPVPKCSHIWFSNGTIRMLHAIIISFKIPHIFPEGKKTRTICIAKVVLNIQKMEA